MSPTSPRQPGGGARPAAAFKVHRDSHSIHKAAAAATSPPSSSSTNSSVSSPPTNAAISSTSHPAPAPRHKPPPPPRPQQQKPVIIYTHSPKVIRTNPRDFMSIVQKLTGLDGPGGGGPARGVHHPAAPRANNAHAVQQQADESSSSSSSESCANAHAAGPPPPYADSQLMPPPPPPAPAPLDAHFVAPPDIPLFAPDASDHQLQQFCAPRGIYGQFPPADALGLGGPVVTANVNAAASNGAVFAPSTMVEAMKTFPHYN